MVGESVIKKQLISTALDLIMDKCIVCDVQTLKYKCPKCYARYCSVACCKSHKAKCSETPATNTNPVLPQSVPASNEARIPNYPLWSADMEIRGFPKENEDDDTVPVQRLKSLRDNQQIGDLLQNPHLRAVCENLVNSEKPSLDMAKAMQEPIFVELADECLKVVDCDNPHLERDASPTKA